MRSVQLEDYILEVLVLHRCLVHCMMALQWLAQAHKKVEELVHCRLRPVDCKMELKHCMIRPVGYKMGLVGYMMELVGYMMELVGYMMVHCKTELGGCKKALEDCMLLSLGGYTFQSLAVHRRAQVLEHCMFGLLEGCTSAALERCRRALELVGCMLTLGGCTKTLLERLGSCWRNRLKKLEFFIFAFLRNRVIKFYLLK